MIINRTTMITSRVQILYIYESVNTILRPLLKRKIGKSISHSTYSSEVEFDINEKCTLPIIGINIRVMNPRLCDIIREFDNIEMVLT